MSKVTIAGDVNGTGVFTIAAPNGNTNRTLTLPDATGTLLSTATPGVPIGGPAFSAVPSTPQTVSSNTATKIQFQSEEWDTNSCFDSTTNSRFMPTVAGYYAVNASAQAASNFTTGFASIYKNGGVVKQGMVTGGVSGTTGTFSVSAQVLLNGSTDYIEAYIYISTGQSLSSNGAATYFQAALVRSAT